MHHLPLLLAVTPSGLPARPIIVKATAADTHECAWDLTLVQAWELHAALGAQLSRHPAPDLSRRPHPTG